MEELYYDLKYIEKEQQPHLKGIDIDWTATVGKGMRSLLEIVYTGPDYLLEKIDYEEEELIWMDYFNDNNLDIRFYERVE